MLQNTINAIVLVGAVGFAGYVLFKHFTWRL